MKQTLALCIAVKDTPEELEKAQTAINSVKDFVDAVYLFPNLLKNFDDNYSKVRSANFAQAKEDWILWLDADDILEHPENLKLLINNPDNIEGFFFKYKYAFDKDGNCVEEHWKAQLLKNNGHFEWKGAIHEDALQLRPAKWMRTQDCVRVHQSNDERSKESTERNLRILLKERELNPNEPRTLFYLGRVYSALGEYQKCIDCLQEYLTLSGWDDERYEASLLIGTCLVKAGNFEDAIRVFNEAILEKESNPDAYFQKGLCYVYLEKYNEALWNFKNALARPFPESATTQNPLLYSKDIYSAIGTCYLHLGELNNSLVAFTQALKVSPKDEDLIESRKFVAQEIAKYSIAQKYVELAKFVGKDYLVKPLLQSVPPSLADNEMILSLRNTFLKPQIWADKTIAIYCGATAETWTPDSLNKGGIGGSETAVIELAKRLQAKGYKVTVFNQCDAPPEGLIFDGVEYQNYWKFNIKDEFNILWVWRLPELFDYNLNAKFKLLDLHDTMTPHDFPKERVDKIDKIFVKTHYHRSLYPSVSDEKFVVINNGIDLSRFTSVVEKKPYKFVYTSSPNRGLDTLLKMWPKIKNTLKDAELHVYYGWNTFYKLEKNNPERMLWMKKVQELMKQDGVIDHGRLGQAELAKELLESSYWLYPTDFPEISCITAMEMQAAGVLPITSGFAALAETQVVGVKVPGDIYDPTWKDEYIGKVIEATEIPYPIEEIKKAAEQFSWDKVAEQWDGILCA